MKLYYITYQDFPSNKANSQQTITTCKYLSSNNIDTTLYFPLRKDENTDESVVIENFYEFENIGFKLRGLPHKLKFEKLKFFKKGYFQLTQLLWSIQSLNFIFHNQQKPDYIMTRADWILFLLSRKNFPVVFECHQLTKTRKLILRYAIKKNTTKIIFMNDRLLADSGLKNLQKNQVLIQSNGYDEDYFEQGISKEKNTFIFAGNLTRSNKKRGVDLIIDYFNDERLQDYSLKIIGDADEEYLHELEKRAQNNVSIFGYLKKSKVIQEMQKSEFGLLINTHQSTHSLLHTDPLKFYEYSAAGLKIIAPDFPAHRNLDKYSNLYLYKNDNKESFIKTIEDLSAATVSKQPDKNIQTYSNRVKNIINFLKV